MGVALQIVLPDRHDEALSPAAAAPEQSGRPMGDGPACPELAHPPLKVRVQVREYLVPKTSLEWCPFSGNEFCHQDDVVFPFLKSGHFGLLDLVETREVRLPVEPAETASPTLAKNGSRPS